MNNQDEQNMHDDNQGDNATSEDNTQDEREVIYILTNEAMPDYIKIGKTREGRLSQRIKELSGTSVPLPFEPFYAVKVPKSLKAEGLIHELFRECRASEKKKTEFFKISPDKARYALLLTGGEEISIDDSIVNTTTDKRQAESLERARERRERFGFDMVDIPVGEELIFTANKEKKVTVAGNRKVKLENGDTVSLSNAAGQLLKEEGYNWKTYRGSNHFEYQGEILTDRRERMEEEDADDDE